MNNLDPQSLKTSSQILLIFFFFKFLYIVFPLSFFYSTWGHLVQPGHYWRQHNVNCMVTSEDKVWGALKRNSLRIACRQALTLRSQTKQEDIDEKKYRGPF